MGRNSPSDQSAGSVVEQVRGLYETFPYPATFRDGAGRGVRANNYLPAIDHYIFNGAGDFSRPMRFLIAGCGTGDALIDLGAQVLANDLAVEFLAVDLSWKSLDIARGRAADIGLTNVQFECRRLEDMSPAADGLFDYVDCNGVLHHLEDPAAGLDALVECLTVNGGIHLMVYGALGRTGVYDAQKIIAMLDRGGGIDQGRVDRARTILGNLPRRNRLMTNPNFEQAARFTDDEIADAFLHPKDRAYTVGEIRDLLEGSNMKALSFLPAFAYDPKLMLPAGESRDRAAGLPWWEQRELAELLAGTMRKHTLYTTRTGAHGAQEPAAEPDLVPAAVDRLLSPVLETRDPKTSRARFTFSADGLESVVTLKIDDEQAEMLALIDGQLDLAGIKQRVMPDANWDDFASAFQGAQVPLTSLGVLFLSRTRFA
jgi:SAM-dependent methyltransferase